MKRYAAVLAAAGVLVLGCSAAPSDDTARCYTHGDLICPPTGAQQAEAWANFDPSGFTEDELSKPFRVTYRGTILQTSILVEGHEWYLVRSSTTGLDHVFEIEFGRS